MLEVVNHYYSDANDLQNVYGRIAGTSTINNVPIVNNVISGYIFDFSAHPYRNFQLYFHLNETYKIFIRTRNDLGFSDWEQIYPDYSNISLQTNGYIVFTNGFILQWARIQYSYDRIEITSDGKQGVLTYTLPISLRNSKLAVTLSPASSIGRIEDNISHYQYQTEFIGNDSIRIIFFDPSTYLNPGYYSTIFGS